MNSAPYDQQFVANCVMNRTHNTISWYKSHKLLFSAHEWLYIKFDTNSFF